MMDWPNDPTSFRAQFAWMKARIEVLEHRRPTSLSAVESDELDYLRRRRKLMENDRWLGETAA